MKPPERFVNGSADDRAYSRICRSTAINFAYAVFRAIMGSLRFSAWYLSSAAYFFVLGIMRTMLAASYRKMAMYGAGYESGKYLLTGWLLLVLNIPVGGMTLLMIVTDTASSYPGYTIYASAAYTFYMITLSVINLFRVKKLKSRILSAAKILDFVAAMMSVLILQNALISEFSENSGDFRKLMNVLTGAGIYVIVIVLAIYMIINIKHAGKEKTYEQIGK